jgi:hypothetical protein
MKHVYVAGPYRATTAWGIESNIRIAETHAMDIARLNLIPVIPHAMYRFYHGTMCDDFWLAATLSILKRCDAIFMLPGWEKSQGSKLEHEQAEADGLPIFYATREGLRELSQWVEAAEAGAAAATP